MKVEISEMLIGGELVGAVSGETLQTLDPATTNVVGVVPRGADADIDAAVASARSAQLVWSELTPVERSRVLFDVSRQIRVESDHLARLESLDTGKPLRQARSDVQVAARYFEFYAGLADKLLGTTIPLGSDYLDYTTREPLGISAQIVPWNYPLQIGARGVAPALAAGNAVVLKPAEEASLSLLELGRIILDAGGPPGVVNIVTGFGEEAGASLARHPGINQLTFTGSVEVGTLVMQAAAMNIVPVTLELGGKCPNVVFDDADLDAAVPVLVNAIIQNAGQTCSAATRLIVSREICDELADRVAGRLEMVSLGPGLDDPDMGPLITATQLGRVSAMVDRACKDGAKILTGGGVASAADEYGGYFYRPTLLGDISPDMAIARQEVFGPVLVILEFDDGVEALELANATEYGLVCGVWTSDIARAHRVAKGVAAGQIYINGYGAAGGAELPFGGFNKSGFGREKGIEGLNSYLQTKNVCVRL